MRLVLRFPWLAKALQRGLFGDDEPARLIPQVKVVNRGGRTHTQIYWVNPDTGIRVYQETRAGAVDPQTLQAPSPVALRQPVTHNEQLEVKMVEIPPEGEEAGKAALAERAAEKQAQVEEAKTIGAALPDGWENMAKKMLTATVLKLAEDWKTHKTAYREGLGTTVGLLRQMALDEGTFVHDKGPAPLDSENVDIRPLGKVFENGGVWEVGRTKDYVVLKRGDKHYYYPPMPDMSEAVEHLHDPTQWPERVRRYVQPFITNLIG